MFSTQHSSINLCDDDGYDFAKPENAQRWCGLFMPALRKVLEQKHVHLTAKEDALLYVETLCLRVLGMLCAKPLPHSVQDVQEKLGKTFPNRIPKLSPNVINILNKRKNVERVHALLQKDVLQYKIDNSLSIYLVAILEYISADILELVGNYVIKIKRCEISKQDIEVAMFADKGLMDMFSKSDIKPLPTLPKQRTSTTYEEVVKELIQDEKQYQRDLHMIIRIFREELSKIVCDANDLDRIFSNINDIYEVTATLLGSLEDVIEMSHEQSAPYVGKCFEELAEEEEFDVYTKYAQEVTSQQSKNALNKLISHKPNVDSLKSVFHGFYYAVKYYLPKLLLVPIWHAFVYFEYIKLLMELSPSQDDIEDFKQVQGLLRPLRYNLENVLSNLPKDTCVPLNSRVRRQLAIEKTRELQKITEYWENDLVQNCNEFIREDCLTKLGKRVADRRAFLFDGVIVICKQITKSKTTLPLGAAYEYRLKEKYYMKSVEINEVDEPNNSFELLQPGVTYTAKSTHHKNDLLADLIMVITKVELDHILDKILLDIEKMHPLRMPSPEIYKFAVPDSPDNIVLEERESTGVPIIKGATLCKLIERLTFHIYADPMFVQTFMTNYRYFCTPQQLLDLLVERFNIPEPSCVYQDNSQPGIALVGEKDITTISMVVACDIEKMQKNSQREDWKRYRKEFVQPVQCRVINVLRHWVCNHFYDFEKDPNLLKTLLHFLENNSVKSMRKWFDSILKIVQRKKEQETSRKQITFAYGHSPPPIEQHLIVPDSEISLLTLHPVELARQLTLLEFELYKNVKPSELVGTPWTKKDKELKSPNLLKILKFSTNVSNWIKKSIIEAENYEERVAMVTRAIEVMMVMLELNNFNGVLSISATLENAAVYRLQLTFQGLQERYREFLKECGGLSLDHLKKYQERLRSINPPCVPFLGTYLSYIIHFEEGNPDYLPNTELINFTKRRKLSEIIGEIQQYQNQPYCLQVESKIRKFLENLDPYQGLSYEEIEKKAFEDSLRLEPRGCGKQPPKFPRKWPSIPLKSPGIKQRKPNQQQQQQHQLNNSNTLNSSSSSLLPSSLATLPSSSSRHSINSTQAAAALLCDDQQGSMSSSTSNGNTNAFSVFANVNLPEHSSSASRIESRVHAQVATALTSAAPIMHKSTDDIGGGVELLPQLPKKPTPWSDGFSPNSLEHQTLPKPQTWQISDDFQFNNNNNNNNNSTGNNSALCSEVKNLTSPLPKVFINHRSPMNIKSAKEAMPFGNSIFSLGTAGSPQTSASQDDNNKQTNVVPVSPHVNVPTATHGEYRAVPPPLPPRRKERTESCTDLAQKRQAPDAPLLPPRDGELSPPPIPPRLNKHSTCQLRGHHQQQIAIEYMSSNSLLLPHTSSIMMRRNSAIEKRQAAVAATHDNSTTTVITSTDNASTIMTMAMTNIFNTSTTTTTSTPLFNSNNWQTTRSSLINLSSPSAILTTTAVQVQKQQVINLLDEPACSVSPALSSSTTTSPMTPMTPLLSHIPTGNITTNLEDDIPIDMASVGLSLNATTVTDLSKEEIVPPPQAQQRNRQISLSASSTPRHHIQNTAAYQQQQQQQHNNNHHHSYQHFSTTQLHNPEHQHKNAFKFNNSNQLFQQHESQRHMYSEQHEQLAQRSASNDLFFPCTAGSTPKLPPKPSLSGNFYNTDKSTMFLYPSTNQE